MVGMEPIWSICQLLLLIAFIYICLQQRKEKREFESNNFYKINNYFIKKIKNFEKFQGSSSRLNNKSSVMENNIRQPLIDQQNDNQ